MEHPPVQRRPDRLFQARAIHAVLYHRPSRMADCAFIRHAASRRISGGPLTEGRRAIRGRPMSRTRELGIQRFPAETMVADSTRTLAGLALTPRAFGRVGQFEEWGTSATRNPPYVFRSAILITKNPQITPTTAPMTARPDAAESTLPAKPATAPQTRPANPPRMTLPATARHTMSHHTLETRFHVTSSSCTLLLLLIPASP